MLRRLSGRFAKPVGGDSSQGEDENASGLVQGGESDIRSRKEEEDEDQIAIVQNTEDEIPTTLPTGVKTWRRSFPQTPQESQLRFGFPQPKPDNPLLLEPATLHSATTTAALSSPPTVVHRNQLVPWEHLNQNSVLGLTRSSVWNGGSGLFDIEQNDHELDRICQLFTLQNRVVSTKFAKESVLDHKRATQISVAMKRLNLVPMNQTKLGKLAWALRDMNEGYLNANAVEIMFKSKLWPSTKEIELLKRKQPESMPECDALLWFLHTSIQDMESRIQAMFFRYEFEDQRQEMVRATGLVKAASSEVCGSELLKRTLRVCLLVGNYVNETFGAPAAWGVHLTSLSKLSTIRTTDKSLSVLDCVVEYLDLCAPECFGVGEECTCTPMAAQFSLQQERAKLLSSRKTLETLVRRFKPMEHFYFTAARALDHIEREFIQAEIAFARCLEHFCLEVSAMDTKEFFETLQEFFAQLDRSVVALEQRQRVQQSTNQASQLFRGQSGLLNPGWMQQRKKSVSEDKPQVKMGRMSVFGRMRPVGRN
ncbi:hypothetical protein BASA81_006456 [Batrachochytrium salamandrivorans]|nr:hypothetical protein BASA81_006456 [Batrachochytrium salamandrivorans]